MARAQHQFLGAMAQRHAQERSDSRRCRRAQGRGRQIRQIFLAGTRQVRLSRTVTSTPRILLLFAAFPAPMAAIGQESVTQPIPRAQFMQLDADKSGFLSPAEFAKLTASPAPANGLPMLTREDINRDNQVSMIEHRTATLANFDRLDTDKNGVVTAAEMKAGGVAR